MTLLDRHGMYGDLCSWLDRNAPPFTLTDDAVAHLADWLVAERGWTRHE